MVVHTFQLYIPNPAMHSVYQPKSDVSSKSRTEFTVMTRKAAYTIRCWRFGKPLVQPVPGSRGQDDPQAEKLPWRSSRSRLFALNPTGHLSYTLGRNISFQVDMQSNANITGLSKYKATRKWIGNVLTTDLQPKRKLSKNYQCTLATSTKFSNSE